MSNLGPGVSCASSVNEDAPRRDWNRQLHSVRTAVSPAAKLPTVSLTTSLYSVMMSRFIVSQTIKLGDYAKYVAEFTGSRINAKSAPLCVCCFLLNVLCHYEASIIDCTGSSAAPEGKKG